MKKYLSISGVALFLFSFNGYPAQKFQVEQLASGLAHPWSLAFAPDGGLYFTNRDNGELRFLDTASRSQAVIGRIKGVRAEGEAGMLGMALDPDFARNKQLYICYSATKNENDINRISSFSVKSGALEDERVLLETAGAVLHNGCRVVVSPDGYLIISMGEGFSNASKAQDLDFLGGKIFRISRDGSLPKDNPFPNSPVWTLGHRNPQGLAFQPGTQLLWSTEHGPDTNDELNIIRKGRNYGWPNCLGTTNCGNSAYEPAVRSFYEGETVAISNLMFYSGKAFPQWKGNLFFVTLKTGRLYRLVLDGEKVSEEEILIDNEYGRLRDVAEGPDGFFYIATESGIMRLRP